MTDLEFQRGLKVFWSSGGVHPDEETLEVWYKMLERTTLPEYQFAIQGLIKDEDSLSTINFVKQIEDRAKVFRAKNKGQEWKEQFEPPEDPMPQQTMKELVHDFNLHLKGIEEKKSDA
jgi:hypothetical protein